MLYVYSMTRATPLCGWRRWEALANRDYGVTRRRWDQMPKERDAEKQHLNALPKIRPHHTALAVKACLLGGKTATLNAQ